MASSRSAAAWKRRGWRGASTRRRPGRAARAWLQAASTSSSSGSTVFPATRTGSPAQASRRGAQPVCRGPGGARSAFRLPPRTTTGAPSWRKCRTEASSRAATRLRREAARAIQARPRARLRSVSRPLTMQAGMPRAARERSRLGQISVSRPMKAPGGWRRKGSSPHGSSRGKAPPVICPVPRSQPGRRCSSSFRPAAVPVVTWTRWPASRRRPRMPSASISSPTLTAWTQIQPGLRSGTEAPRRSRQLSGRPRTSARAQ